MRGKSARKAVGGGGGGGGKNDSLSRWWKFIGTATITESLVRGSECSTHNLVH